MRIGFDITPLHAPPSGVGVYATNLWRQLNKVSDDEMVPLAHWSGRAGESEGPNLDATRNLGAHRFGMNKTLWLLGVVPWALARRGIDVCHFTNSVAPLWAPCPTVVTVHDMTLWLLPQHHYPRRLLTMRPLIPNAARRATAIIAVSQATKRDIVRILRVPEEKVYVIYEAPAPSFRPLPAGPVLDAVRRRYSLPKKFILFVGTIEPRKNLVRLLEAFAALRTEGGFHHDLILVGNMGWNGNPISAAVERLDLGDQVRYLGYVPTPDLVALYNLSDALAFPSLYEGFGLPVVEAMACGTPVICSSEGSLAEVAGSAAEFVQPDEVGSIASALRRVLTDDTRKEELRVRGLARVTQFSWTRAAEQTRQLYAQAASTGVA